MLTLPEGAQTLRYCDVPTDDPHAQLYDRDPGPWDSEPDKVQWIDPETGLDCLIVRNRMSALCGYVGVPNGHPLFEVPYDDIRIKVHGDLTFSDRCQGEESPDGSIVPGICHVPAPGRPHDVWWLGFDCGHAFDLIPGMAKFDLDYLGRRVTDDVGPFRHVYRDLGYVIGECTNLARQIATGNFRVDGEDS